MGIRNKDIAEKLGISKTAVSLAVNNRPGVSEETRRKVLKLIRENAQETVEQTKELIRENTQEMPGQRKQQKALRGNLKSRKTILLSVHKTNGTIINDKPFFSILLETAQQEAMKHHCSLVISHFLAGQNIEDYMRYLEEQEFDGLIIEATEITEPELVHYRKLCEKKGVPAVLMDGSFDMVDIDAVEIDNTKAIFREVEFAVNMGHHEIGYLASNIEIMNFVHRHDGFWKGIHFFHLEDNPHPVISLSPTIDGAYTDMKQFLTGKPKDYKMPTLFITDLDSIAIGAMKAMAEKGYRIPEEVSFIGFDDIEAAELCMPPLTTTRVNRNDIGRVAVDRLIHRMEKNQDYYETTQISSTFIIRQSVKVQ